MSQTGARKRGKKKPWRFTDLTQTVNACLIHYSSGVLILCVCVCACSEGMSGGGKTAESK